MGPALFFCAAPLPCLVVRRRWEVSGGAESAGAKKEIKMDPISIRQNNGGISDRAATIWPAKPGAAVLVTFGYLERVNGLEEFRASPIRSSGSYKTMAGAQRAASRWVDGVC